MLFQHNPGVFNNFFKGDTTPEGMWIYSGVFSLFSCFWCKPSKIIIMEYLAVWVACVLPIQFPSFKFVSQVLLSSLLENTSVLLRKHHEWHSSKNKQELKCFQEWRTGEYLIQEQSELDMKKLIPCEYKKQVFCIMQNFRWIGIKLQQYSEARIYKATGKGQENFFHSVCFGTGICKSHKLPLFLKN